MPSRLFVGNLPYEATESEVREHFAQVAPVARVFMPLDRETGKPRGFAFVEFTDPEQALAAIQQLHQKPFKDRALIVNEARPSESRPPGGGGFSPSRSPSFSPQSRERTTLGGSSAAASDGSSPRRSSPPPRSRRRAGSRRSWDEPPKKEPIPEKRRGQIFGGYDEDEDEDDIDFENFATGLPETDDED